MSSNNDADVRRTAADRPPADRTDETRPRPRLEHVVVENDGAPDECAIFPEGATEPDRDGAWIAALEGAFVDLETTR